MERVNINAGASKDAFRWAIVGYGKVAVAHTEGIVSAGHKLTGFSTTNEKIRSGDATGLTFNIGPTQGRLFDVNGMVVQKDAEGLAKELLKSWIPGAAAERHADGVIIACPTKHHMTAAKIFGLAGFPCFIEKPAASTARDARELLQFFKQRNLPVVVGHVLPAFPEFAALRSIILQKGIENVTSLTMRRFVPWKDTDDEVANREKGGAASDLLIHDANLLGGLGNPEEVRTISSGERYGLIQTLVADVKLRNAAVPFQIMGGASELYDGFHHSYDVRFKDGTQVEFDGEKVKGMEVSPRSVGEIFGEELELAVNYFTGKRPDASFLSMEGAINALTILEAAIASAKKK